MHETEVQEVVESVRENVEDVTEETVLQNAITETPIETQEVNEIDRDHTEVEFQEPDHTTEMKSPEAVLQQPMQEVQHTEHVETPSSGPTTQETVIRLIISHNKKVASQATSQITLQVPCRSCAGSCITGCIRSCIASCIRICIRSRAASCIPSCIPS